MKELMGGHVCGRNLATPHQVSAKPLQRLELLRGRATGLEIPDQTDADRRLVPVLFLYVSAVQLSLPAAAEVDFAVLRLAGTVGDHHVVGQPVLHAACLVHLVHVYGVVHVGGAVVDDDFLPFDEEVCMVTFDILESKNAVLLNKTPGLGTDYYKIFKYD